MACIVVYIFLLIVVVCVPTSNLISIAYTHLSCATRTARVKSTPLRDCKSRSTSISTMAPGVLLPEKESTTYYVPESSRKQMQSYANTEIRGKTRDFEAQSKRIYNDWRDDFFKHGYSLVKQAVPRERALGYQKRALDWLQKFDLGLDYNDPSTFNSNHLPVMMNGGMVLNYCAAHEDWVWQTRW